MKIINDIDLLAKNKVVVSAIIILVYCLMNTLPAYAKKISLTQDDHKSSITINVGDRLEITLKGNPTTGYVWQNVEGDHEILSRQGDDQYIPAEPILVGSGGRFIFTFLAASTGKTRLRIIYHRTFEKNTDPKESLELLVIIE